jgi:hypothetical protein
MHVVCCGKDWRGVHRAIVATGSGSICISGAIFVLSLAVGIGNSYPPPTSTYYCKSLVLCSKCILHTSTQTKSYPYTYI